MFTIRGVVASDADALFPMIFGQPVTDTLVWEGPESLEAYRVAVAGKAVLLREGKEHFFTIVAPSGTPAGTITLRPESDHRANIGLWIGAPYHGQGAGTQAVAQMLEYGFGKLGLAKIEASVFVGNLASRRIFEKNGFRLEGTVRAAVKKRGRLMDEWLLGLIREEFRKADGNQ